MAYTKCESYVTFILGLLMVVFSAPVCLGVTDPRDVAAISSLFSALQSPPLRGWSILGDPCGEDWEGVQCVFSNITGIVLSGSNLSGELGDALNFASIITIDLSNNRIGGSIPSDLPPTVQELFISGNLLNGSIPSTLASLTLLSNLSFSNNHLTGEIPDSFHQLNDLSQLDLSSNNLSGQLPPSLGSLQSVTTLNLGDNRLTGTLDILQNLPLIDLNIENNLFSGPIPANLISIPNFIKNGNPFNTTVIPTTPVSPPASTPAKAPDGALPPTPLHPSSTYFSPKQSPAQRGPAAHKSRTNSMSKRIVFAATGVTFILLAISVVLLSISKCCPRRQEVSQKVKKPNSGATLAHKQMKNNHLVHVSNQLVKGPIETVVMSENRYEGSNRTGSSTTFEAGQKIDLKRKGVIPPPPYLPAPIPPENPFSAAKIYSPRLSDLNSRSVRSFTIALLQQITNSFSAENFIGRGMLASVYRAELPNGELLAVKKLDVKDIRWQNNDEFLQFVHNISKLKNQNVVELVGYCAEHGQKLLVYQYCSNGNLYDALHSDEDIHRTLSWNIRIQIAIGVARALEYLHEVCQPPTVHRNLKSANVLLDEGLHVRVSDCGLAPLLTSFGSGSELPGYGYGAPECELGTYTCQSDVYCFGVVMLELLTGRKSFDRRRPRSEQYLVRWAIPQLHDIDALSGMVDPALDGAYPSMSLSHFADIISLCVQREPEFRPPMSEIVRNLSQMIGRKVL